MRMTLVCAIALGCTAQAEDEPQPTLVAAHPTVDPVATSSAAASAPAPPAPPEPLGDVVAITSLRAAICALVADGQVYCAGSNGLGELGDGTYVSRELAAPVVGISDAIAVSGGRRHACALLRSGRLKCWGGGYYGQLGDGALHDTQPTPVDVVGIDDATAVAAGDTYSCALRKTGVVMCWGANDRGHLGDGTTTMRLVPTAVVDLDDVVEMGVSGQGGCARRSDGSIWCWGGFGYPDTRTRPQRIGPLPTSVSLMTGKSQTCSAAATGDTKCWWEQVAPTAFGDIPAHARYFDRNGTRCTVTSDGEVACADCCSFQVIPLLHGARELAPMESEVCARMADGLVKCVGYANATRWLRRGS